MEVTITCHSVCSIIAETLYKITRRKFDCLFILNIPQFSSQRLRKTASTRSNSTISRSCARDTIRVQRSKSPAVFRKLQDASQTLSVPQRRRSLFSMRQAEVGAGGGGGLEF